MKRACVAAILILGCDGGEAISHGDASSDTAFDDASVDAADALDGGPDAPRFDGGVDATPADAAPDVGRVDASRDAASGFDASGGLVPARGGSSRGTGGGPASGEMRVTSDGISYRLVVPSSYREGTPNGLLVVFSGTEGASTMTMNLRSVGSMVGLADLIYVVLDGPTYFGDGAAGASALDAVRSAYDIDNDRTFLLSESAGTRAGLQLGLDTRQSYFAAYWANDVNAAASPRASAAELGFAPWGNAGPGGDFADANAIVAGMRAAGYRIEEPAPYNGAGSGTHGAPEQFVAALRWFVGRSR